MKKLTNATLVCICTLLLLWAKPTTAQVGINTTNPQNDLDVNGGMRIQGVPVGNDDDATQRLLSTDVNGDVVSVTVEQITKATGIPKIAYNAKFSTGSEEFFQDCEPCANETILPLFLISPQTNFLNSTLIDIVNPSSINGDEYFLIKESGLFRFELNANLELTGDNRYFINLRLDVDKASGGNETDVFRVYAGQPAPDNPNGISVPIYATDLRAYEVGDKVYFSIVPPLISGPGLRRLKSTPATGATYIGQFTVTKFE